MLAHGVRPVVELSFMPRALVSCDGVWPNGTKQRKCDWAFGSYGASGPGSYRGLSQPPDDFEDWYNLVYALAAHMVDRHGLAEVSQWKWEVPSTLKSVIKSPFRIKEVVGFGVGTVLTR